MTHDLSQLKNFEKSLFSLKFHEDKEKNKISEYCRLSAMKKLNLLQFNFHFYIKKLRRKKRRRNRLFNIDYKILCHSLFHVIGCENSLIIFYSIMIFLDIF